MKKLIVLTVLAGLVVLGACTKIAAMKGPFDDNAVNPAFVQYMTDKADDRLDLSEAQRTQFEAMVNKMMTKALQQRPEANALRDEMAAQVRKPALDMDCLDALLQARMQLFGVILRESRQDLVAFHASLNAEQRQALAQAIVDHGKKGWHGAR